MRIAIDFDNTIVSYGTLFTETAYSLGYISDERRRSKTALRDHLRSLPAGEAKWRRVQAVVYGSALTRAAPFPGLREFLTEANERDAKLFIVSHKSRYAAADDARVDLRQAARAWLRRQDLIGASSFRARNVHFCSTLDEKVARIVGLNCTHVVDDLMDVFNVAAFPSSAQCMLFTPEDQPAASLRSFASWYDIRHHIFANDSSVVEPLDADPLIHSENS